MQEHIKAIDGLRGLACIWILMHHLIEMLGIEIKGLAVVILNPLTPLLLFFIMSGYVITSLRVKRDESIFIYLLRRYLRLAPTILILCLFYWVSIEMIIEVLKEYLPWRVAIYSDSDQNWTLHMLLKATLLYGLAVPWLPYSATAIIPPGWSVTIEWQFYLIAPFLVYAFKDRRAIWWVLAFLVCLLLRLFLQIDMTFVDKYTPYLFFGVATFFYVQHIQLNQKRRYYEFIIISPLIVIPLCILMVSGQIMTTIALLLPYAAWCYLLYLIIGPNLGTINRFIRAVLEGKILQAIGKVSYSFYLLHMLSMYLILYVFMSFDIMGNGFLFFIVCFVTSSLLTYIFSVISYRLIEVPSMHLGSYIASLVIKKRYE